MNVALITISDRGDLYMPTMRKSFDEFVHVDGGWSAVVRVDDRNHDLGMAGAVAKAWKELPKNTDYVFHVEEDWRFVAPVDVTLMCQTIMFNTHLAQLCLKRGPGNTEESLAGGMVEAAPDEYEDADGWLEHSRCFSLNPCVYPHWLTTTGVPMDPEHVGVERVLTDKFVAQGLRFGVWGARRDPPMVEHIGWERSAGWRL